MEQRDADFKMVKVRLPDGRVVMRKQRSPVKLKETIIQAINDAKQLDENYVLARDLPDFNVEGGFALHPSVIDANE